jgi:uncharacterized protein YjiS (DUF1127 family)
MHDGNAGMAIENCPGKPQIRLVRSARPGRAAERNERTRVMSVYEITRNRPVPLGSVGIFAVVSGAETLVGRLRNRLGRRATVAELRRLSDDQLADIGLTRADVAAFARGR